MTFFAVAGIILLCFIVAITIALIIAFPVWTSSDSESETVFGMFLCMSFFWPIWIFSSQGLLNKFVYKVPIELSRYIILQVI